GVAWSPDGKRLASVAQGEGAFRVWDAVTGKLQGRFAVEGIGDVTPAVAWSPDGKAVALGFNQGPHGLFDAGTGQRLGSFHGQDGILSLAWGPEERRVVTAGSNGVRWYDGTTGKPAGVLEDFDRSQGITSLAWSPDSQMLALGRAGQQNALRVEAATGRRHP